MALIVLGVVTAAPLWWWRRLSAAAVVAGRHWLPVLLLVSGVTGLIIRVALVLYRRRRTSPARRREPVATWLPLSAHVAGMLLLAVVVCSSVGVLLWWALGGPTVGLSASPVSEATPPLSGVWTVQNTFDAMKIVLSVMAGTGAVVALTVAYRRQDQGEAAEYREDTKLFNERFGRAADQLGAEQAAVRLAGVYAMARLADDWADGRQTCIDVLCAYLRMPYTLPADRPALTLDPEADLVSGTHVSSPGRDPVEERQVRHTILRSIRDHLQPADTSALRRHIIHPEHRGRIATSKQPATCDERRWNGCHFDLTGAVIDGGDLTGIDVPAGTSLDLSGATFSSGAVDFSRATFSGGEVSFSGAAFCGGRLLFRGATFSGDKVSFDRASFSGSWVSFAGAIFSDGVFGFTSVRFSDGWVSFADVAFSGRLNFTGATFSGGDVSFGAAMFSDGDVDFGGATFSRGDVSFGNAIFSGGNVHFDNATFSGGKVHFGDAIFSGGKVSFNRASFSGSWVSFRVGGPFANICTRPRSSGCTVDLMWPLDWSVPPDGLESVADVLLPSADHLSKIGKKSSGTRAVVDRR